MKIGIVIDSNGGLNKEEATKKGYLYIPMPLVIDDVAYRDGDNISYDQFLEKAKVTKGVMLTSQVNIYDVIETWQKGLTMYDHLIHISLSSGLSRSYDTCLALSRQEEFLGKVDVVDTMDVIGTYLYTTHVAKTLAGQGMGREQLLAVLEQRKGKSWGILVPETLNHLKRGGRINAATAAIGNFLNFKPLIKLENGALEKLDKERGSKEKGLKKIILKMLEYIMDGFDDTRIPLVMHTQEPELLEQIKSFWQPRLGDIHIASCNISAIVVCHTGPGAFAVASLPRHPGIDFEN